MAAGRMKPGVKTVCKAALLLAAALAVLSVLPLRQRIVQQVPASRYRDGVAVEETRVEIDGEKTRYLFRRAQEFHGKFAIPLCEITTREAVNASIDWDGEHHVQHIGYMMPGEILDTPVQDYLLMGDDMTEFALMLEDGSVLATSPQVHRLYTQHVSLTGPGRMTIVDLESIPRLP